MPQLQETDLYMMVGEIRSDVKKLLQTNEVNDKRIGSLERKIWTASGAAAFLGMMVTTAVAKVAGLHW